MRPDKNTIYILSEKYSINYKDGTFEIHDIQDSKLVDTIPMIHIDGIIIQGYVGISTHVMYKCIENDIEVTFVSNSGEFLTRIEGKRVGNIDLRKLQLQHILDIDKRTKIAKSIIAGKINNQCAVLERALRSYEYSDKTKIKIERVINYLELIYTQCKLAQSIESIRGYEGEASKLYFSVFDDLIIKQKDSFHFNGRTRQPPEDEVNSMLSYLYVILQHEVNSALNIVGFEIYAGFIHSDVSGRESLSLDIMEELRPIMVDRVVLRLINLNIIHKIHFTDNNGAILLNDKGKQLILEEWHKKKSEIITHPYLKEKTTWGQVPYYQALVLARSLRGQIDNYVPYKWR